MPWIVVPDGTLRGLTDQTVGDYLRGDAAMPRFFLTGDGHREPPFRWTNSCPAVRMHFVTLLTNGQLCAHVELHQADVNYDSVPSYLSILRDQGKLFGWELSIYKDLMPPMELANELVANGPPDNMQQAAGEMVAFERMFIRVHSRLASIGNPPTMALVYQNAQTYKDYFFRVAHKGAARNMATEAAYYQFLRNFTRDSMALRTVVNPAIAANINARIQQFPNDTHLITCGDAHIRHNPLQNFIGIGGATGLVDASAH